MDSIRWLSSPARLKRMIGTDAFQEVDTFGITLPVVKHSYLVRNVHELEDIVNEAFYLAQEGKPGPVVIDIPKDVTAQLTEYRGAQNATLVFEAVRPKPSMESIELAVEKILSARQPVFYVGGGVVSAGAADERARVVEMIGVPVTPTLMGLGGVPTAHPQCLGMLGMHGTYAANLAVAESDLLVAIGVRFDDRVTGKLNTFAPTAEVIHIDIDASNIGKSASRRSRLLRMRKKPWRHWRSVCARNSRQRSSRRLVGADPRMAVRRAALVRIFGNRDQAAAAYRDASQVTNGDAIVVTDVGQHQCGPRSFILANAAASFSQAAARDDGLWPSRGDGRSARVPERNGSRGGRRRRISDDESGDHHGRTVQDTAKSSS